MSNEESQANLILGEDQYPQLEAAKRRNEASFSQLTEVLFGSDPNMNSDQRSLEIYKSYCPDILGAFETAHGDIIDIFLCESRKAAAVLTKKHKFFTIYPLGEDVDIIKHLIECDRLELEARRLLSGNDLEACVEMLYSAAKMLLSILNSTTGKNKVSDKQKRDVKGTINLVKKVLDSAQEYHNRAARLKAQRNYFQGMLVGILVLSITVSPFVIFASTEVMSTLKPQLLIVSLICGGIGAIVSVMSRMGTGNLILDHEAGATVLRRLGAFRPIVGAIFGAVIYTLLESNLIPITIEGVAQNELFYAATGFIAGFSERWAPDMLAITKRGITASVDE